MSYSTHIFNDKDILTHDDMNNIISGIDELKLLTNSMSVKEKIKLICEDTDYSIREFMRPAGTVKVDSAYKRTDYIDISQYDSIIVHGKSASTSVSPAVWFDEDKNYLSGEVAPNTDEQDFEFSVPENAVYVISSSLGSITCSIRGKYMGLDLDIEVDSSASGLSVCYISASGSDDNDGATVDTPIASFNKAKKILDPNGELIFLEGDYKNFSIDLSYFSKISTIGQVRLLYPKTEFITANLVSGYTKVYSTPYTGTYTSYLWQMDIPDANTAISAEERHPLHRNRTHRLEHTRIYPITQFDSTSTNLSGYLSSMESNSNYTYYMDGTNLYFTSPNVSDFSTHPIVIPNSTAIKGNTNRKVNISGLKIYFAYVHTTGLSGSLNNIFAGYVVAPGAIRWDNTFNLTLNNCEVAAGTNDGINGHTSGDVSCYNCYGHDFCDDGESDHETCHIVQHGGLYEYNGNGCTPASGASGEYFNTIVRNCGDYLWTTDKDGSGFSSQGVGAGIYCNSCYVSNCEDAYRSTGQDSYGTFINCVADSNCKNPYNGGIKINSITVS